MHSRKRAIPTLVRSGRPHDASVPHGGAAGIEYSQRKCRFLRNYQVTAVYSCKKYVLSVHIEWWQALIFQSSDTVVSLVPQVDDLPGKMRSLA